jgi:hypothetical protein
MSQAAPRLGSAGPGFKKSGALRSLSFGSSPGAFGACTKGGTPRDGGHAPSSRLRLEGTHEWQVQSTNVGGSFRR